MQQHDPAAKIGVWAYYLFTLASFLLALFYLIRDGFQHTISIAALPIWMGYTIFTLIKSIADLIGAQKRTANFTRMLARWEDAFGKRGPALALLIFMTLAVALIQLAVPVILMMLARGS